MYKIMIVEDDTKICEIISENIRKWGYEPETILDFNNVLNEFIEYKPDLVLLDINLPAFDGFYWCNKIREISKVPIIFISSRNTNMDVIMSINMGGDDFITKPLSIEVLMAKINALLRRTYSYINTNTNVIEYNGVVLNLNESSVIYDEQKLELTKNEFKILSILMKNSKSVVSRDKLMRELWKDESFIDDNTLTVNINRLRKKLTELGLEEFIKTKKGQGYILS